MQRAHCCHAISIDELETYKLDGDLLVVEQVCAFEDDTKRTLSYLLSHSVVHTDDIAAAARHGDVFLSLYPARHGTQLLLTAQRLVGLFRPLAES